MEEKIYTICRYHRGEEYMINGTIDELNLRFGDELLTGSWYFNTPQFPSTISSLVNTLNKVARERPNRYGQIYYKLVENAA